MSSTPEALSISSSSTGDMNLQAYLRLEKNISELNERISKLEKRDIDKNLNSLIKSLKFISWFFPILAILMLGGYLFFFDKTTFNQLYIGATAIMVVVEII